MKRIVSRTVGIVVLLGVVGVIVFAFIPKPVEVESASVTRGPMRVTVDEDGQTRIREKYVVSAPLAGQLQRIILREGDEVEAGRTVLARIEPGDPSLLDARALAEAEARVRRAEAALQQSATWLEQARAELDFAEDEFARLRTAADQGAATSHELNAALTEYRTASEAYNGAQFEQEIAKFELELARAALIRSRPGDDQTINRTQLEIHAPIDGRVLRVFQESMAVVQAGAPLLELGDPTDLEIVVDVLSTDAVRIQPGAEVIFEYWGGEEPLHGRVRLIEPQAFTKISALGVEEQRVNVIIDFTDPPEVRHSLGDAYRVEARIVVWEEEDVLQIPTSALFRMGADWATFVLREGAAVLRRLEIGRQTGLQAQVLSGLEKGDVVVTHPSDEVEDGRSVVVRETGTGTRD